MPRSPSKTQVVLTLPGHMPPAKAALHGSPWDMGDVGYGLDAP